MDLVSPQGVMDLGMMSRGGDASAPSSTVDTPPAAAQSDEEYCKALEAERQKKSGTGGAIGGRLGGRFGRVLGGRNKQEEEPVDPRCVKK
jgi:hypothetical protein